MLSGDLNSKVNLGSYVRKRNQFTGLLVQNARDLNGLEEATTLLDNDLRCEIGELEVLVEALSSKVRNKCVDMVANLTCSND